MNATLGTARPRGRRGRRGNEGYALIFALSLMLIMLIVGLRFLAVAHSRQRATDNEKTALQAGLIADAGLARAAYELSQDMSWNGAFLDEPLAGGTYTASVTGRGEGSVTVSCEGVYGDVTRRRVATVYTPVGSGTRLVWGTHYGTDRTEWKYKQNLIDSALGESGVYAFHLIGGSGNKMSLAGFDSDLQAVPVQSVSVVISGYVSRAPVNDYLMVQWYLPTTGAGGAWHIWDNALLREHLHVENTGRISLDVTSDPPPGGWQWQHFAQGTDLELRFASVRVGSNDNSSLYVDCAGLSVTWDAGM